MKIEDEPSTMAGVPLYKNNSRLKAANVGLPFTADQINELKKIISDPIYLIETYCRVISIDHGYIPLKLYDYQKKIIKTIHNNRKIIALSPRQSGKCVTDKTVIKVKNKITGKIMNVAIGDFYEKMKDDE